MEASLIIMAAGVGSRFGRLKQLEPIGPSNETLLEFSIRDALIAGFNHVSFIIREETLPQFQETLFTKLKKNNISFDYSFQNLNSFLPSNFTPPQDRSKPWGTAHALLCAKNKINSPFCVINADDYYGPHAFKTLHDFFLSNNQDAALVAYTLSNTLSDNGYVSRGLCQIDSNQYLTGVTEHTKIFKDDNSSITSVTSNGSTTQFNGHEPVSLNFWGFQPSFLTILEDFFNDFIANLDPTNLKAECYLPSAVNHAIDNNLLKAKALASQDSWLGMTYEKDLPNVKAHIAELTRKTQCKLP